VLARIACALLLLASLSAQQTQQQSQAVQALQTQPSHGASTAPSPRGFLIAGVVVNALTGQAVPAAAVAIAPVQQGKDRGISKSMVTGADGRFSFSGLSGGKYSLMAEARGFSLQYFDHHDPFATAIAVGPDRDTEPVVFRLQADASLEGDVTDDNNDPVQNAQVRLFQTTTENGEPETRPVTQTHTNDLGHYRIGHLSPGAYYLAVSARPWYAQNFNPSTRGNNSGADPRAALDAAALDVTYPLTFYPGTTDSADATPLQLTPGERETADVTLHAVPSLHLRIYTAPAESGIPNPAGSRAMVFPRISRRIFGGYLDPVFNAPSSWVAPGVVEISALAPGRYMVEVPPSTGLNGKSGGRTWYREIDLAGDMEISASDGPGFATVAGTVFFQGVPRVPSHSSVRLSNPDTGETFRSDITDKGQFDFSADDIRPGRYIVGLEDVNGFFLERLSASGAKLAGRTLEITGASSVRINALAARGAARVDGTALHDDQPYAGAMIVLVPQDAANNAPLFRRDQSDSDGTFTLRDVVPGQYMVIAIANGWELEWANPAALQPYLKQGGRVEVPANGKLQIKVQVQ
jgi:hypothetical protein